MSPQRTLVLAVAGFGIVAGSLVATRPDGVRLVAREPAAPATTAPATPWEAPWLTARYDGVVAGAAPADCRTEDATVASENPRGFQHELALASAKRWCVTYAGPGELRSGAAAELPVRICRSGDEGTLYVSGLHGKSQPQGAYVWFVFGVRHADGRWARQQKIESPPGAPVTVAPGDCVQWTVEGWEARWTRGGNDQPREGTPLEPGTYSGVVYPMSRTFQVEKGVAFPLTVR